MIRRMERDDTASAATAEGEASSVGEAKADAIRALEPEFPGIEAEDVEFEVLDDGDPDEGRPARVRATVDESSWVDDEDDEELPDAPAERIREMLSRVADGFGLSASVEIEETDEEIRATVNGDDLGLLIGKHGNTIDALQHLAMRVGFRGRDDRKAVVVDAAGYRERREGALQRAADQAVSDALAYGRAVELEPMSSPERRIVHTYLRDRTDVQTHSEGDEPERRLVVTPVRST
jgi:spoIIIJ-associated protein